MVKDKLEVGLEYWLDEEKTDSGLFIGHGEGSILFKRISGTRYSENEDGFINFSEWDQDFYLVSKNPTN